MNAQILLLFNNLLFILVALFVYQFWLDRKKRTEKEQRTMLIICTSICAIYSMSFPAALSNGFILDLRQIPLIINILYGGIYAAIPLAIITLGYRIIIGGVGIVAAVCMGISIILISLLFSKRYLTWNIRKRVVWSMFLGLYASLLFCQFIRIISSLE